ncbi:hypothetical protein R0J87_15555 [Halomonas sp. SIMBA_159]
MKKSKCLSYRIFPDDVPSNFAVSAKSYLALIFWLPLGGIFAIKNGLSALKNEIQRDPDLTEMEAFAMRLSIVTFGPFMLLGIVWDALKEAVKGRLMCAGIEEFEP